MCIIWLVHIHTNMYWIWETFGGVTIFLYAKTNLCKHCFYNWKCYCMSFSARVFLKGWKWLFKNFHILLLFIHTLVNIYKYNGLLVPQNIYVGAMMIFTNKGKYMMVLIVISSRFNASAYGFCTTPSPTEIASSY